MFLSSAARTQRPTKSTLLLRHAARTNLSNHNFRISSKAQPTLIGLAPRKKKVRLSQSRSLGFLVELRLKVKKKIVKWKELRGMKVITNHPPTTSDKIVGTLCQFPSSIFHSSTFAKLKITQPFPNCAFKQHYNGARGRSDYALNTTSPPGLWPRFLRGRLALIQDFPSCASLRVTVCVIITVSQSKDATVS